MEAARELSLRSEPSDLEQSSGLPTCSLIYTQGITQRQAPSLRLEFRAQVSELRPWAGTERKQLQNQPWEAVAVPTRIRPVNENTTH